MHGLFDMHERLLARASYEELIELQSRRAAARYRHRGGSYGALMAEMAEQTAEEARAKAQEIRATATDLLRPL